MEERQQFNLMASFWHAGKELPDDMRLAYYDALLQYGFTQTLPEKMHPVANALMITNKPTLDISWTRYLAKHGKTKQDQNENKTGSSSNQMQEPQKQNGGKEEGRRKKEKGNIPPLSPPSGDKPKRKKKTSMYTEWFPEQGYDAYAKRHGIEDPDLAVDIFKDWAIAGGKTYADWNLTWKNACRTWLPEKVIQTQANQSRGYQSPSAELEKVSLAEPVGWLEHVRVSYSQHIYIRMTEEYGGKWENVPLNQQEMITENMTEEVA